MNKRGQTLVIFTILLPIFLFCCTLVIDVGLMIRDKIKGSNLLSIAVENKYDISDYFELNDINIKKIKYVEKNGKDCVIINYSTDSVFGKILGYKEYQINIENCK